MRLRPERVRDRLDLYAYSHLEEEFNTIQSVLLRSEVNYSFENIQPDTLKRRGIRYSIIGNRLITKFENYLQIKFSGTGKTTNVEIGSGQNPYKCKRIDDTRKDCETIYADDDHSAFLKCALLANKKNWLGGDSEPGVCELY